MNVIARLSPEEREFMTKVCEEIEKSRVDKVLPVLYAGSGGDVEHAVLLGNNLVFVDPHLPEETLLEIKRRIEMIDGKIVEEERKGELGKGGKHVVKFLLDGEEIKLTYYAEDATKIGREFKPEELERGYFVYFVKVPLPKEEKVGSLTSPESLGTLLKHIAVGGFYLERECPISRYLDPRMLGFEKVASGPISALSINYGEMGNLYRKIKEVEEIALLLKIDHELYKLRNKSKTVEFSEIMEAIYKYYNQLPDHLKQEVEKAVRRLSKE